MSYETALITGENKMLFNTAYPTFPTTAPLYRNPYQFGGFYPTMPAFGPTYGIYPAQTPNYGNSTNQLLQLLLTQLLGSLDTPQQNSPVRNYPRPNNLNNITNNSRIQNNGDIESIINNFIFNAKNVNIAGINNGVQLNNENNYIVHADGSIEYCPPGHRKEATKDILKKDVTVEKAKTPTTPTLENRVWGDPHIEYKDQTGKTRKYDFQGEGNQWFNAIQDGNLTMNAFFTPWGSPDMTVMTKIGMDINGQKLSADVNGKPTLNGEELKAGQTYSFDSGITDINGDPLKASVTLDEKGVINVNSGEYQFQLIKQGSKSGNYFDVHSGTTEAGSYANGKTPDGFMGPIFDPNFENFGKDGKQGKGAQGEGFLDKKKDDYKVGDAFDQPKYTGTKDVEAQWGVLAKKGAGTAA